MFLIPMDDLIDYLKSLYLDNCSPEQRDYFLEIVDSIIEYADNFAIEGDDIE